MELERYIQQMRPQLDEVERLDEDMLWMGIQHTMSSKSKQKRYRLLAYASMAAAAIAILLAVSVLLRPAAPAPQLIFVNLDPGLAKQEAELVSQIQTYSRQLQQSKYNLSSLPTSPDEVSSIDRLIEQYTNDLKTQGSNPELMQSLISLYQTKLQLLQRMLNEIERAKKYDAQTVSL